MGFKNFYCIHLCMYYFNQSMLLQYFSKVLQYCTYIFNCYASDTEDAPHMIMYPNHSTRGRHTGLVVVVTLVALVGAAILGVFFCKRKKIIKQNAYITFSTPKYRREQLPNNDFNMESPLTLSSNGYTVLA